MFSNSSPLTEGFSHFGLYHFITLLICILSVFLIYLFRDKFKKEKNDKIFRYVVAISMIVLETTFLIWSTIEKGFFDINGKINKDLIPFELCSVVMWVTAFALIVDSKKIIKVTTPAAVIGTMLAYVFSDMGGNYIFPHFRFIHFFGLHTLFTMGSLYYFFTKKIDKYTYRDNLISFGWFIGYGAIIMIFNYVFDYNYLFLRQLPDAASFFQDIFKDFYVIPLIIIAFGLYQLMYLFLRNREIK